MPGKLPPPIEPGDAPWSRDERLMIAHTLRYSVVGAPDTVTRGLDAFIETTKADEILVTGHIYDHASRLRSFEIVSTSQDISTSSSATSVLRSRT